MEGTDHQKTPQLGHRIREIREGRGLSLRALAQACALSTNAISMIERGESSPRVSTLHTLAEALNARITDFFETGGVRNTVLVRRDDRRITQGEGVTIESAGSGLAGQQIEPFVVEIQAEERADADAEAAPPSPSGDQAPGNPENAVQHPGQEFVFCLEGIIEYRVGAERYVLEPGDSLLFHATEPHSFRALPRDGDAASAGHARMLLVLQAPEGTELARERHLRGNGRR